MFAASSISRSTATPVLTRRTAVGFLAALAALFTTLTLSARADAEATPPVSVSALSSEEVESLLSGVPLSDLSAEQLSELLSTRLAGSPTAGLKQALKEAIAGLAAKGGTLGELAGSAGLASELEEQLEELPLQDKLDLEGLLGLSGAHTLSTALSEALGSLEARQVVGALLTAAGESGEPTAPERLIEEVLEQPTAKALESLLGSKLSEGPFSAGTVGELASEDGTTSEELAKDFDTTSSQLPATAMALTAPLADGKTLGVLDAIEGIDVGTLTHELPGGSGGSGGSGGGTGGPGGDGGAGGASPGGSGGLTILMPGGASAGTSAKLASGHVQILSRKLKGDTITLVLRVPAAGTLTVKGKGVRSLSRQTDKAERLTVRAVLSNAEAASLRKGHHRLRIGLDVSFKPLSGASSKATTNITIGR
jgi:hypothetical protein